MVLACQDEEVADRLAAVLANDGMSVVVLKEISEESPELKGADLLIVDGASARALGEGATEKGSATKILLSERGATIEFDAISGRYADILVVPAPDEEVIGRVRHAMGR